MVPGEIIIDILQLQPTLSKQQYLKFTSALQRFIWKLRVADTYVPERWSFGCCWSAV